MRATAKQPSLDKIFRALSDPTRLRILNLLRQGELCVCDLVDVLGVLQPAASRHLSYLRKMGLVRTRKEEQWVYYRLTEAQSAFHESLLACLTSCAQEWSQLAKDIQRLKKQGRSACCD
jgi:ArsR family transcriptional regulator, arsenate/arsenite/antimonite-responsive transcriptional repressor